MYSILRPELLYTNLSPDVVEHDNDIEVYTWEYDGQEVYRGSIDLQYMKYNLNVYSLYDENLKRVGLVEHDADDLEIHQVLWFYDNPFARFYQNPEWKSAERTLWSMLTSEAYQDCLEDDFKTVVERCLTSKYRLVTPEMLINPPMLYKCASCGKQSLSPLKNCKSVETHNYFSFKNFLYVDDSFIIYEPPSDHQLPDASYEQAPKEEEQAAQLLAQPELRDAESPVSPLAQQSPDLAHS
jgi:hypothetical protein